jgi:hypothetical protein
VGGSWAVPVLRLYHNIRKLTLKGITTMAKSQIEKLRQRLAFLEKMIHISPWPNAVKRSIANLQDAIKRASGGL